MTDNLRGRQGDRRGGDRDGDSFSVLDRDRQRRRTGGLPFPELPGLLDIARVLHAAPGVELAGVMTHAGHSYHESTPDGIAAVAEQSARRSSAPPQSSGCRHPLPHRVGRLDAHGHAFARLHRHHRDAARRLLSSTTSTRNSSARGGAGDLALSVLASVIGHYLHRNQVLVDAGALALSKDISAQEFKPQVGYGTIVRSAGQGHGGDRLLAGARLRRRRRADPAPATCRSAAHVRILPNHACITAAAYDRYYVVDSELDGGKSGGRRLRSHQRVVTLRLSGKKDLVAACKARASAHRCARA